jgi:arylsulfatase A-like enzyme
MSPVASPGRRAGAIVAAAAVLALTLAGCGSSPRYEGYNLVLMTIETTRSDFLGCYGSPLGCTPHLDSLAARGTLVERYYTVAPWTRASMASLWTGLVPGRHGATLEEIDSRLPAAAVTIAEILSAAGYRTFGYVTNSNLSPPLGFDQGFESYAYTQSALAPLVTDSALAWLDRIGREPKRAPVLVALHFDEPHSAYFQAGFDQRIARKDRADMIAVCDSIPEIQRLWAMNLYMRRLREVDAAIGAFVARAAEVLGPRTLFVVAADHGEEWFDHGGLLHGHTLHDEVLSVPLLFYVPRSRPARIPGPVRSIDVLPTLLGWLGVQPPAGIDGESLEKAFRTRRGFPSESYSETAFRGEPTVSVQRDGYKLIKGRRTGRVQLFERGSDPREQIECAASRPDVVRSLGRLLDEYVARADANALVPDTAGEAGLSPDDRERLEEELRSIGYLGASDSGDEVPGIGRRIWWKEFLDGYRFVAPDDSAFHVESKWWKVALVPPRIVLGTQPGDRIWGTFSFQRAFVLLDGHQSSGIAEVQVDGTTVERVDLYSADDFRGFRAVPILMSDWGEHRIDVVVTGEKNPAALSSEVLVNGLAIAAAGAPGATRAAANAAGARGLPSGAL